MGYLVFAQFLGAFIAAFMTYLNYYDFIKKINEEPYLDYMKTAGAFATYPSNSDLSTTNLLLDQIISINYIIIFIDFRYRIISLWSFINF